MKKTNQFNIQEQTHISNLSLKIKTANAAAAMPVRAVSVKKIHSLLLKGENRKLKTPLFLRSLAMLSHL